MPRSTQALTPYFTTDDGFVRLYHGHVVDVLRCLPAASVHCAVTSPPYWGLRDYGTGTWEGGDPACEHKVREKQSIGTSTLEGSKATISHAKEGFKTICSRCGARRIDRQLGSESRPDCGRPGGENCAAGADGLPSERDWATGCYVCRMVLVLRELRRVLRDDGVFWLNLGDSYGAAGGRSDRDRLIPRSDGTAGKPSQKHNGTRTSNNTNPPSGNLVGIPWRVAARADGRRRRASGVGRDDGGIPRRALRHVPAQVG